MAVDTDVVVTLHIVFLRTHEQGPFPFHIRNDIVVLTHTVRLQRSVNHLSLLVVHRGSNLHIIGRVLLALGFDLSEEIQLVFNRLAFLKVCQSCHQAEVVAPPSLYHHQQVSIPAVLVVISFEVVLRMGDISTDLAGKQGPCLHVSLPPVVDGRCIDSRERDGCVGLGLDVEADLAAGSKACCPRCNAYAVLLLCYRTDEEQSFGQYAAATVEYRQLVHTLRQYETVEFQRMGVGCSQRVTLEDGAVMHDGIPDQPSLNARRTGNRCRDVYFAQHVERQDGTFVTCCRELVAAFLRLMVGYHCKILPSRLWGNTEYAPAKTVSTDVTLPYLTVILHIACTLHPASLFIADSKRHTAFQPLNHIASLRIETHGHRMGVCIDNHAVLILSGVWQTFLITDLVQFQTAVVPLTLG